MISDTEREENKLQPHPVKDTIALKTTLLPSKGDRNTLVPQGNSKFVSSLCYNLLVSCLPGT